MSAEPKPEELTEAEREADLLLEVGHPSRPDRLELMRQHIERIKAAARREALLEAADAVVAAAPSRGAELDPRTGQEDPGMAAYVEGFHDAHATVKALAEPERDEEGGR